MEKRNDIRYSIIVPVYNVEEYLVECLDSLINQTYKAYEIILVDDGSTDKSGSICDSYVEKNSSVRVFHKKNGGLSDARNYGIDQASGDYMIFVDSDDYIDVNMLQIYYQASIDNDYPDLLIDQSMYAFCDDTIKSDDYYDYKEFGKKNGKEAFMTLLEGGPLWSPCSKCYKITFWKENDFHFTKGIYAEDLDLIYKVVYLADSVVMTPTMYYYREKRQGSISNTIKKKKFMDIFNIIDGWESFFKEYQVENKARDNMYFYFGEIMFFFIMGNLYLLEKSERKEIFDKLREYHYVCYKYNNFIGKTTNIFINLIGIEKTSFLLFCVKRICLKVMKRS